MFENGGSVNRLFIAQAKRSGKKVVLLWMWWDFGFSSTSRQSFIAKAYHVQTYQDFKSNIISARVVLTYC